MNHSCCPPGPAKARLEKLQVQLSEARLERMISCCCLENATGARWTRAGRCRLQGFVNGSLGGFEECEV